MVTEWDKLWENVEIGSSHMSELSPQELRKIKAVGDKLQRTIATGYCGECDINKEKLETIRKIIVSPKATDLIKITFDILEVLGEVDEF